MCLCMFVYTWSRLVWRLVTPTCRTSAQCAPFDINIDIAP